MKRFSAIFLFSVLATVLFVLAANAETSNAMDAGGQFLDRARFALSCLEAKDCASCSGNFEARGIYLHPRGPITIGHYENFECYKKLFHRKKSG